MCDFIACVGLAAIERFRQVGRVMDLDATNYKAAEKLGYDNCRERQEKVTKLCQRY